MQQQQALNIIHLQVWNNGLLRNYQGWVRCGGGVICPPVHSMCSEHMRCLRLGVYEGVLAPALRVLCLGGGQKNNGKVPHNSSRTRMGTCTGHKGRVLALGGGGGGLGKGRLGDTILSRVLKNLGVLARQTRKNIPGTRVCRGVKKQK